MTPLNKTVRRLTVDEYGYGRNRRKLVVALEKGDLITLREHGCRNRHTARLWDLIPMRGWQSPHGKTPRAETP